MESIENNLKKINNDHLHCSFCKKSESQVTLLIGGDESPFICDACIVNSFNLAVSKGAIVESNVMKLYKKSVTLFVIIIIFLSIIMIRIFFPSLFDMLLK